MYYCKMLYHDIHSKSEIMHLVCTLPSSSSSSSFSSSSFKFNNRFQFLFKYNRFCSTCITFQFIFFIYFTDIF